MPADLTKPFSESCCDGGACNNDMSAQSCGCDPGLKPKPWVCERHKLEAYIKELLSKPQEHEGEYDG